MVGRPPVRKRQDARTKIVEAAEKLYAIHGVDAVSIRQINSEAGQRNGSAVHYHFGSRDGLLEAILELHTGPANALRLRQLEILKDATPEEIPPVRGVVEALVRPLFDGMNGDKITYYRRFLYQVQTKMRKMDQISKGRYDVGLRECYRLIRWRMPDVPRKVLIHRYMHSIAMTSYAGANLEEMIANRPGELHQDEIDMHVELAVDSVYGIFTAPVSERTSELAEKSDKLSEQRKQAAAVS